VIGGSPHKKRVTSPLRQIDPRWILFTVALSGCASEAPAATTRSSTMSETHHVTADASTLEANKTRVRRLFEEGLNQGNFALLDELISPAYRAATGPAGPAAFRNIVSTLRTAIPDIHYEVEEIVAEQGKVAARWHWKGTHSGTFRGFAPGATPVPATGAAVVDEGIGIFELEDGKIVKSTLLTDRLGFLQAIGVVPPNDKLFQPKP
jgi:steroid delta-isomerase-like uncharacterized protein